MIAGTQSGKTSFGPHWLYREIQTQGPGDYLAVTSTFPLLKLKMLPEFLRLFDETLHLGRWLASDKAFRFHDGKTRVIFGSATHPSSLESATAKGAWLDEVGQDEFRLGSWEAIQRRLSLHQGRVLAGTTPYNLGWLKQQVFDAWRRGDPAYDVIQFDSTFNPSFPLAEYRRMQATLPAWKFQMFYRGMFERPAGLIYGDYFDTDRAEGGHLVAPFVIPPEWPRYGGVDFGAVHTARLLIAHDPIANVFYLYSESLVGGKTSAEHAHDALAAVAGTNMAVWYGGAKSEVQQRLDWQAAGLQLFAPEVPDVEAGIDRIIALWRTRRLYVFTTCTGTRDQLGSYARVPDDQGEPTEKIKDKETYHYLDALRYVGQALGESGRLLLWDDDE